MVGQHIRALKDGRWVHAIDCGDQTVLHLADEAEPRCVRRAYRPEFVAGAHSVEHVTHRERTFPPKEIVRRAYSRAADPALATMFRDSEAFAAWCTTGRLPGARNVAVGVAQTGAPQEVSRPAPGQQAVAPRAQRPVAKAKPARAKAPSRKPEPRKTSPRTASRSATKRAAAGKRSPAHTKARKRPAKTAGTRRARRSSRSR